LRYDIPTALDSLSAVLRSVALESVEIQHFLHLDPKVIDAVRALPVPYDVFVHDYAWVCPRITLIDGSGRYCGEPAICGVSTLRETQWYNLRRDHLRAGIAGT